MESKKLCYSPDKIDLGSESEIRLKVSHGSSVRAGGAVPCQNTHPKHRPQYELNQ